MSPKLNVYNMADMGVNVTKSPLHLEDGELTKAQNWQTDPALADGAVRRRDALAKLNSSALAGSVKGLIALPLPSEFTTTRTFYAPIDDATTNTWRRSSDGTTWATITTATLRKCATTSHANVSGSIYEGSLRGVGAFASLSGKIYFPGDDYNSPEDASTDTPPTVYSWDGTTERKLFVVPRNPYADSDSYAVTSIVPYSATELLVSVFDIHAGNNTRHGRVFLYDTVDGTLEQLGPESDIRGGIFIPFVYQGRAWIAPANFVIGSTQSIQWVRPGDAAWVSDANFEASAVGGVSMAEFLGDLYLGTHSSAAVVSRIRKRTTSTAAWTSVFSTDGSGTGQYCGPLIVTADGLTILAYMNNADGTSPEQRILSSTDGTSWSTDLDIVADLGTAYIVSGTPYRDSDGSSYWPIRRSDNTGFIKKRTSAGTWSTVDTIDNLRGPVMALKTVS